MSASGGSTKVIVIALFANLGIAVAKTIGAIISGSASLFAEAIHSFVDCTNQVLLLLGAKKARKAPTESHPLGYGRESFFWSFVVTILLFSMGGLFAIYEGVHKLSAPEPISYAWLVLIILFLGIALEGYSFLACLKEIKHVNRFDSLTEWYRKTTASGLLVIFTEDAGALIGLIMAAVCVSLSWGLGDPAWDAYGSIMIGVLLVVLAGFLGVEIKSLLIGEAPSRDYDEAIKNIVNEHIPGAKVLSLLALQIGDTDVMISFKLTPGEIKEVPKLIDAINDIELKIKKRFPEIKWQFVEPDNFA